MRKVWLEKVSNDPERYEVVAEGDGVGVPNADVYAGVISSETAPVLTDPGDAGDSEPEGDSYLAATNLRVLQETEDGAELAVDIEEFPQEEEETYLAATNLRVLQETSDGVELAVDIEEKTTT